NQGANPIVVPGPSWGGLVPRVLGRWQAPGNRRRRRGTTGDGEPVAGRDLASARCLAAYERRLKCGFRARRQDLGDGKLGQEGDPVGCESFCRRDEMNLGSLAEAGQIEYTGYCCDE